MNVTVQANAGEGNAYSVTKEIKLDVKFMITFDPDTNVGYFNKWEAYANYGKLSKKTYFERHNIFKRYFAYNRSNYPERL